MLWWLHITSEVQKEVARLRETIATTKERKMSKNKYVLTKTTKFVNDETLREQQRRILGPIYEEDPNPLIVPLGKAATSTVHKSISFVISLHKCGFILANPKEGKIRIIPI
ncbi:MAG: hypothetical protein BWY21_00575 [Parcubacteria group bacterium ADurb.Bin216]|nr:MAG: hypothetical protein BWY21_00575 [Parcubacteria group bacterium ADurb.Bin216]